MSRVFTGGLGSQVGLLEVDPRDWLPVDHLVWRILRQVSEIDLSEFCAYYRADGVGGVAYDPAMMLTLVLYCYAKKVRSVRAVAAACHDDLGCRVICGPARPDSSTISRFVGRHRKAIDGLLVQTLRLCAAEGLIDLDTLAGDGTKLKANASRNANLDQEGLAARLAGARAELDRAVAGVLTLAPQDRLEGLQELAAPAARRPVLAGRSWRRACALARQISLSQAAQQRLAQMCELDQAAQVERVAACRQRVARAQARLEAAQAAKLAMIKDWQAKVAAKVAKPGRQPVPPERCTQIARLARALTTCQQRLEAALAAVSAAKKRTANTTDPQSRIMPGKKGNFDQLWNVQAIATRSQIIVAIMLHDNSNDKKAAHPLIAAARANLDTADIPGRIHTLLFDNGYAAVENFTSEHVDQILTAACRENQQIGQADTAANCQPWQDMADLLAQPENKKLYRERSWIIEPVFGQLTNHFGRDLHYRGTKAVTTELNLMAVTHNLAKLARYQARKPAT